MLAKDLRHAKCKVTLHLVDKKLARAAVVGALQGFVKKLYTLHCLDFIVLDWLQRFDIGTTHTVTM